MTTKLDNTHIKVYLPLELYEQWRQICPNRLKQRQLMMPVIDRYLKGQLHPNDMPYFKRLPKGTPSKQIALRCSYGYKKSLINKLNHDQIPITSFMRSIVELIIKNSTNLKNHEPTKTQ